MSNNLQARMRAIVERLAPDFQEYGRREIELLLEAGADSEERLRHILQDQELSTKVRTVACWVLARLGDKRAAFTLLAVLKDLKMEMRAEAARSLGVLGSVRAVRPLIKVLSEDASAEVRAAAAYALGLLGDKRALPHLLDVIGNQSEDLVVRGHVAEALGEIGDTQAVPALIAALEDAAAEVRFWAAFALGKLGDRRALPELGRLAATDESVLPSLGSVKDEAAMAIQHIQELGEDLSTGCRQI